MKSVFILAGSTGTLGSGIISVMLNKDFHKVYTIDRRVNNKINSEKIVPLIIENLNDEKQFVEAFSKIETDKETVLFLFSTIGGYFGGKEIWETEYKDWENMININLNTSFLLAKHFSLKVKESFGGSICFTSAYSSITGEKNKAAYNTSKNALNYLVNSLSKESEKINLTVNAIAPFVIDTPANREWMSEKDLSKAILSEEIGEFFYDFLKHIHFFNGNVLSLPFRLPKFR